MITGALVFGCGLRCLVFVRFVFGDDCDCSRLVVVGYVCYFGVTLLIRVLIETLAG